MQYKPITFAIEITNRPLIYGKSVKITKRERKSGENN